MPNQAHELQMFRQPTADRPLAGHTVLLIEDSRFASEALRLMCLHSGARIRRADTLASARRHLRTYRPTVLVVDLGLPDGDGTELIAELASAPAGIEAILAISGDEDLGSRALEDGAQAFLSKPLSSLAYFQATVLAALPEHLRFNGPRRHQDIEIDPDPLALADDLGFAVAALRRATDWEGFDYAAAFLVGVARTAQDEHLESAAAALRQSSQDNMPLPSDIDALVALAESRIERRDFF